MMSMNSLRLLSARQEILNAHQTKNVYKIDVLDDNMKFSCVSPVVIYV